MNQDAISDAREALLHDSGYESFCADEAGVGAHGSFQRHRAEKDILCAPQDESG